MAGRGTSSGERSPDDLTPGDPRSAGVAHLAVALGAEPPGALARLDPADTERLAAMVERTRARRVDELDRGGDAALSVVPRVLRGPFRRALGI